MATEATTETGNGTAKTSGGIDIGELSRRMAVESFNAGNYELVDQYVAADAGFHDASMPARMRAMRGPELFKQLTGIYRSAFSELTMEVDEMIVQGDSVASRWHCSGVHTGELEGLAPTGRRVTVTGMTVDHWRDGKVVDSWNEWDNLGLARQIGAAPAEDSLGEKLGTWMQRLTARRLRRTS